MRSRPLPVPAGGFRRIAVLRLGQMVAVRPAAELDRQIVVDYMTSGVSTRGTGTRPPAGS